MSASSFARRCIAFVEICDRFDDVGDRFFGVARIVTNRWAIRPADRLMCSPEIHLE